jgi:hypothetical protein
MHLRLRVLGATRGLATGLAAASHFESWGIGKKSLKKAGSFEA